MQTLKVHISADYGYSCCYIGHNSEETVEISVDDSLASKIEELLKSYAPLDQTQLAELKKHGHAYLKPLIKQIEAQWEEMNNKYWIAECKENPDTQESLENYIINALANGEWLPSKSDTERSFTDMVNEFILWLDNKPIEEQFYAYGLNLSHEEKEYEIKSVK